MESEEEKLSEFSSLHSGDEDEEDSEDEPKLNLKLSKSNESEPELDENKPIDFDLTLNKKEEEEKAKAAEEAKKMLENKPEKQMKVINFNTKLRVKKLKDRIKEIQASLMDEDQF